MNQLSRRSLIAGSIGAGLALPAFAQVPEGCGEQPKTAPALQPPLAAHRLGLARSLSR